MLLRLWPTRETNVWFFFKRHWHPKWWKCLFLVYLLNIYIFLQNKKKYMKQKANKSARIWEGKGKKAIEQTGTTVLVFFFICTRQVYPFKFFFKTHSTKRKKNKSLTKKEKKTIVQCCPSVFNAAGFFIMGDRWGGGLGGAQKWKIKHTGRQTGCVLALETFSCKTWWNFMQHIANLLEQLLYKWGAMEEKKKPVPGKKKTPQSTVHNPRPPRVYKHARSHMTNTPFLTGQASELAYMSLYIIYLYLVKNKLHNSTNLETCFLQT